MIHSDIEGIVTRIETQGKRIFVKRIFTKKITSFREKKTIIILDNDWKERIIKSIEIPYYESEFHNMK